MSITFNTAIFYDVENLLKGYSFSQQIITNLSLKQILDSVRDTGKIGHIALQRAYANWSDPRLAIMRGEINELGIDPVQVFGFSKDPRKNAADIQLAIDAIDLAHLRPILEVFVIVSGDGGFAALAKKLHEYGKIVIGCAYRSTTNKTFQAVCDDFVWINDPEEDESFIRFTSQPHYLQVQVNDPRNVRLSTRIKRLTNENTENIIEKTKEIFDWYAKDSSSRMDLLKEGIHLSVVQEAVSYAIPQFQPIKLGFAKFIEYMQFVCSETHYCIARSPTSQAVLALRNFVPLGMEILPDLEKREIHSLDTYISILATGSPIFRLPSSNEIWMVAKWITENMRLKTDLGTLIESTVAGLEGNISSESAKLALLSFISSGAILREPEGIPLSEQQLSLQKDISSPSDIIKLLKHSVCQKLMTILSEVNESVVDLLISDNYQSTTS